MPITETRLQAYGEVADNCIGLEKSVTEPIVEGLGTVYASFMALYVQYQKHHFVVEGSEYYMLHDFFSESYEAVQGHAHEVGERLHGLGEYRRVASPSWQNCAVLSRKPMMCFAVG